MREIDTPKEEFNVVISRKEAEYLRELTQNSVCEPYLEDASETALRLSIFVGASRLLGYNMNDNGTINR